MKITDNLIIALLKLGVLGEIKNFRTEIAIPGEHDDAGTATVTITADSLQLRMNKEVRE